MVEASLRDGSDIRGRGRRPKMFTPIALTQISHDGCQKFLAYWRSKRNGGAVPDRHDFDPLVEVPSLAAGFFIYDVEDEARDFRLRLMGTGLVQMFGRDVTGQLISSYWSPAELDPVLAAMRSSLLHGEPVAGEGSFYWEERDFIEWQTVVAPVRIKRAPHAQIWGHTAHLAG